jgi:hypothetical protein
MNLLSNEKNSGQALSRVFELLLHRKPAPDELLQEPNNIEDIVDLLEDIVNRPEYKGKFLANETRNFRSAEATVIQIFELLLGQMPDEGTLHTYTMALNNREIDGLDIITEIVNSDEFGKKALSHPSVAKKISRELYPWLSKDAQGHAINIAEQLEAGADLETIIASSFRNNGNSRDKVVRAFNSVLDRDPEESIVKTFTVALDSGAIDEITLVLELINSAEFARRALRLPAVAEYIAFQIDRILSPARSEDASISKLLAEGVELEAILLAQFGSRGEAKRGGGSQDVTRAFQLVLDREPDEVSLNAFSARLNEPNYDILDMISELLRSEERALREREFIIREAFKVILLRDPEPDALQNYLADAQKTEPFQLIRELLASNEFGQTSLRHASVAKHVIRCTIETLMGRSAESSAIDAYSGNLINGAALTSIIEELISSEEFRLKTDQRESAFAAINLVPSFAVEEIQNLITDRLIAKGFSLWLPPNEPLEAKGLPISHLQSLLYTLEMISARSC